MNKHQEQILNRVMDKRNNIILEIPRGSGKTEFIRKQREFQDRTNEQMNK